MGQGHGGERAALADTGGIGKQETAPARGRVQAHADSIDLLGREDLEKPIDRGAKCGRNSGIDTALFLELQAHTLQRLACRGLQRFRNHGEGFGGTRQRLIGQLPDILLAAVFLGDLIRYAFMEFADLAAGTDNVALEVEQVISNLDLECPERGLRQGLEHFRTTLTDEEESAVGTVLHAIGHRRGDLPNTFKRITHADG
ncbi:hypothetical protein [Paracoccus litorisediminis]|uniref:hypothetical protein n=1 Tax=Paracoccus litorisediminis TaxID=2006130 RepID=UPI0037361D47